MSAAPSMHTTDSAPPVAATSRWFILEGRNLTAAQVQAIAQLAGAAAVEKVAPQAWRLVPDAALPAPAVLARMRETAARFGADINLIARPRLLADYRLAVMDMDSTLITIECIDEIADMLGIKPEVAAITEAAMRGEIAYTESLRRRVALLKGLDVSTLDRVYDERLRLSPGAETMLAAFRQAGLKTLLVSGGFTFFTDKLKSRLGLDFTHSNVLGIADGKLTGEVVGPIVDADEKARTLLATCARLGCAPEQAIAMGDGANDLAMMKVAGLSVAYRAKPVVRAQAMTALNHNGLDAALRLFA